MGELIIAGVRAGLRFWWPGLRAGAVQLALLALLTLAFFYSTLVWAEYGLIALYICTVIIYVYNLYVSDLDQASSTFQKMVRLACSWFLLALFMFVLGLLFFVVILCTLYAVASAGSGFDPSQIATWASAVDHRGRGVASTVFVVGLAALGWAAMRVWLASTATVAEDRVAMLSTWPYTRGQVIAATATRLILTIPAAAVLFFFSRMHLVPTVVSDLTIVPAVIFAIWFPPQVGAAAEFYRRRVLPSETAP